MNELLFNQIAKRDLDNLNNAIYDGYFETSDFKNLVSRLATVLDFLSKAMEA